jgi:hypothetical protein
MVNSDVVNLIEKLLDLQWCIPALGYNGNVYKTEIKQIVKRINAILGLYKSRLGAL